jgi:hypothetical protein
MLVLVSRWGHYVLLAGAGFLVIAVLSLAK